MSTLQNPIPPAPVEPPIAGATPRRKRRWWIPVAIVAAFLVGLGAGGGGAAADPTASTQYKELSTQLDQSKAAVTEASDRADKADASAADTAAAATTKSTELDARSAQLDKRSADLDAREAAVTGAEKQAAASQIKDGMWTVGVDIEPGTYRTAEAVTSTCYWAILRTGSNGADIIENDVPTGGFPSVTLKAGQDFKNSCGVWAKQ